MRIAILTSGRFHVCDLARELDALGHDLAFYSCIPKHFTRQFGLPNRCNRCLFLYSAAPFLLTRKTQKGRFKNQIEHAFIRLLDSLASKLIGQCDVFIGMSGMSTRTARTVRQHYGAKVWIERGSRHILSQKEILEKIPGQKKQPIADFAVRRELADYELADMVVVPSRHVEESFLERGFSPDKLFRNPYGVDLTMFPPTEAPLTQPPTIINVGTWSLRKGCDVLVEAWQKLPGTRLLHVGAIGDCELPRDRGFEHHDPKPQCELKQFYAQAHLFALASREEGLSVVQAQALACGLPVVCTNRTGGEDLRDLIDHPDAVSVVPCDEPERLAAALQKALSETMETKGLRNLLGNGREKLSWRAYGQRYSVALESPRRAGDSRLSARL